MFIQTDSTPNPQSLKFLPSCLVSPGPALDFPSKDSAGCSPLALRLFEVEGVVGVYFGADFVTITKDEASTWAVLKPLIVRSLMEGLQQGVPVHTPGTISPPCLSDAADSDPVVLKIQMLLDRSIRPALAQDGGDVAFRAFTDGIVYLSLRGACSGCPRSRATLKQGIETFLKEHILEVKAVEEARET